MPTPPLRVNGLQMQPQASNPFTAGQYGVYIGTDDQLYFAFGTVAFPIAAFKSVADTTAFGAIVAGSVPLWTVCLIQSVNQIQITQDGGTTWKPYS